MATVSQDIKRHSAEKNKIIMDEELHITRIKIYMQDHFPRLGVSDVWQYLPNINAVYINKSSLLLMYFTQACCAD